MANYRTPEGKCEVFQQGRILPVKCGIPNEVSCNSCPIAVTQTGDRSMAQALADYREIIAQNLASPKA